MSEQPKAPACEDCGSSVTVLCRIGNRTGRLCPLHWEARQELDYYCTVRAEKPRPTMSEIVAWMNESFCGRVPHALTDHPGGTDK